MQKIKESYKLISDDDGRFDIELWQQQGDIAIFNAALEMITDYMIIRQEHADKPGLQRTIEYFGKA